MSEKELLMHLFGLKKKAE